MNGPLLIGLAVILSLGGYLLITASPSGSQGNTSAFSAQIVAFAQAILQAENSGTVDPATNNPGNLIVTSATNSILQQGWTRKYASSGVSIYDNTADGWNALYNQLQLIVNGQSALANPANGDTISDLAYGWTTTNPDGWAETVAGQLGVIPDTPLSQVLS